MNLFKRFFGHLRTVMKHRREVRKLCFKCGLYWQGLTHDLSKYSPTEFINGVKYFTGTYSPHVAERKTKGYSDAWLHHKGHNKHHAEYWQDIQPNGTTEPIDMPLLYLAEMVCDRVAACKVYLKDKYTASSAREYYDSHQYENKFSIETRKAIKFWLYYLAHYGEEKTFAKLKEEIKKEKAK